MCFKVIKIICRAICCDSYKQNGTQNNAIADIECSDKCGWKEKKGKPLKWPSNIFTSFDINFKMCAILLDGGMHHEMHGSVYSNKCVHEPIFRSICEQYEMRIKCELQPNCNMIRGQQTRSIHTHVRILFFFVVQRSCMLLVGLHNFVRYIKFINVHIYYCNLFRAANESQNYRQNARQETHTSHIHYTQYTRWYQPNIKIIWEKKITK